MIAPTSRPTPAAAPASRNWRGSAACIVADSDLFFPTGTGEVLKAGEDKAKKVCGGCLVLEQCRSWALETRQADGVWGGMSERERRAVLDEKSPVRGADPEDVAEAENLVNDYGKRLRAWDAEGVSFAHITHRLNQRMARKSFRAGGARRAVILIAYALMGVERPEEFKPRNPSPAYDTVLEKWDRVEALQAQGWGRRRIAPVLGVSRSTLEKAERIMRARQRGLEVAA